jgi:hypothetical protein
MIISRIPRVTTHGSWVVADESNEQIEASLTQAFTTSTGKTITHEEMDSISKSFLGWFFFLTLGIDTVTTETTSRSVSQILTHSVSQTCSASCDNPKNEPVALYQWQTLSEEV